MSSADRTALRAATRAHADDLLRFFERRVPDREDAADLLSDTLLVAWRRREDFPGEPERQRMWLFGVAHRTLANHRRGHRRRNALVEKLRAELRAAPVTVQDTSEAVAVRDAISCLDQGQRELVTLLHWEGFTITEAAEILGLNASTARSRYAAARSLLKAILGERSSVGTD